MGFKGSGALNRAQRFAGRYMGELAGLYGIDAVKQFRDISSKMMEPIERIAYGNKTQQ